MIREVYPFELVTVIVQQLLNWLFLIHLLLQLWILLFLVGLLLCRLLFLLIDDFLLVVGPFDLRPQLISLLDAVDMAKQLHHQHCFDLIFDVLAGNVVLLYHEFFLFVF